MDDVSVSLSKRTLRNDDTADDLRPEYDLDYSKAKPNRFASNLPSRVVAVVLEPDVAEVFDTSESVNRLLRSVISAMPTRRNGA